MRHYEKLLRQFKEIAIGLEVLRNWIQAVTNRSINRQAMFWCGKKYPWWYVVEQVDSQKSVKREGNVFRKQLNEIIEKKIGMLKEINRKSI